MSDIILPRRGFLKVLAGLIAAPAIVKASSLMKVIAPRIDLELLRRIREKQIELMIRPPIIYPYEGIMQTFTSSILHNAEDFEPMAFTSLPISAWRQL